MVSWEYYDRFEELNNRYLPPFGEGETKATQIVAAVNKLVYEYYNDGDVYDNTCWLTGWANDISSFANWLHQNTDATFVMSDVWNCHTDEEYEDLLKTVADMLLDAEYLERMDQEPKIGSIYSADGPFKFIEPEDEEDW